MSQNTSDPKVIVRERDGAFLCYQKHGKGRCRKKVASSVGEVVCDNGHSISLYELMNAYLKDGLWVYDHIGALFPSKDAIEGIIKRIATPEFLHSTTVEWQNRIVSYLPFMVWLIERAERFDRKAAMMFKDFLEKKIRSSFKLLGTYMDAAKNKSSEEAVRVRQRIFQSVNRWNPWQPLPESYLAHWEIHLEAATYLEDTMLMDLYQYNVNEAAECVQTDGEYCPLYFHYKTQDGVLWFSLLPDPLWRSPNWGFNQITLHYISDRGLVVWYVDEKPPTSFMVAGVREMFHQADKRFQTETAGVGASRYIVHKSCARTNHKNVQTRSCHCTCSLTSMFSR